MSHYKLTFDDGGTVEMLNGEYHPSSNGEHLALWHCVNEVSINCLPVMMANGAKPNNEIWELAFRLDRCEWVHYFLKHGFRPAHSIVRDYAFSYNNCWKEVTFVLCQQTVLHVLLIAKHEKQPMSHMLRIIARFLFSTKYEAIWLNLLQ